MLEQHISNLHREFKLPGIPTRLQQLKNGINQECMVIEVRRKACAALLVTGKQASVDHQVVADKVDCLRCGVNKIVTLKYSTRDGQAANGQSIP